MFNTNPHNFNIIVYHAVCILIVDEALTPYRSSKTLKWYSGDIYFMFF